MSKTITLTAPDGYEFTGEFRCPQPYEVFLSGDMKTAIFLQGGYRDNRYILRKIEPPVYSGLFDDKTGAMITFYPGDNNQHYVGPAGGTWKKFRPVIVED